jgi:16S rRNA (cytosine967-C5)-methyltransferase
MRFRFSAGASHGKIPPEAQTMALPAQILTSQTRALQDAARHLFHAVFVARRPADRELATYLRQRPELGSRDRRLISETLYAIFRWWGWLRHCAPTDLLAMAEENAAGQEKAPAGSWEKLFLGARILDGLPLEAAAVFWAERAVVDFGRLQVAAGTASPEDRCARFFGLCTGQEGAAPHMQDLFPAWVAAELAGPASFSELAVWMQRRPPLWLRVQKGTREAAQSELKAADLNPEAYPALENAVKVTTGAVNLYTLPAYRGGGVEVQDLASQAVGAICAPAAGERWWDPCAGGGGKSLLLASLMRGKGTVVAGDIREKKLESLRLRARRGGFSNIQTRLWDGKRLPADRATFDGVLADVPCTCSGTWRRNPAARWSTRPGEVGEMASIQAEILRAASSGVKPGGRLVYSTCSMFSRENEAVVRDFLRDNPHYVLEPFIHPLTGATCPGTLSIWPWEGDCDAMFVARMRRSAAPVSPQRKPA